MGGGCVSELEAVGSDIRVVPVERVPPPEGATPFDPSHLDCFTKFRCAPSLVLVRVLLCRCGSV